MVHVRIEIVEPELARELEMVIARRVVGYGVEMVEVMIMNQDIIDINLLIFKNL